MGQLLRADCFSPLSCQLLHLLIDKNQPLNLSSYLGSHRRRHSLFDCVDASRILQTQAHQRQQRLHPCNVARALLRQSPSLSVQPTGIFLFD